MTKATGPTYEVKFRRRREGTTDFCKRLALVKSGSTRMVVRRSNRNVRVQFVEYDPKGDKTILTVDGLAIAEQLKWPSKRNVWTAYLAGMYAGREAAKKGVKEFVLDIGRYAPSKGNIVFAAMKGAVDAGLKTSYSEDMVPSQKLSNPPADLKGAFEEAKKRIAK